MKLQKKIKNHNTNEYKKKKNHGYAQSYLNNINKGSKNLKKNKNSNANRTSNQSNLNNQKN